MDHLKREHEKRKMCKDEEEKLSFHAFIKASSTDKVNVSPIERRTLSSSKQQKTQFSLIKNNIHLRFHIQTFQISFTSMFCSNHKLETRDFSLKVTQHVSLKASRI